MSPRLRKVLAWIGYATFYLLVLLVFAYVTFPYDRVRDRIVAEYNAGQPADGMRLEIDELDGYWLSGVELEGVRLVGRERPPGKDGKPGSRSQVEIPKAHVRASILRRLLGVTHVTFGADAFEGEVSGVYTDDDGTKTINLDLEGVDVGEIPFLDDVVGLPMTGAATGRVELVVPEGKYGRADVSLRLRVADLAVGDGKKKVLDTIALPRLRAGALSLKATATGGRLKIDEFKAKGPDFELVADGKIRLRDPVASSLTEINMRFRFTDGYRRKNDITKALFAEKGGLFELHPKVKRSKRGDGFYGWRLSGPFSKLSFEPSPMAGSGRGRPRRGRSRSPRFPRKK